MQQVNQQGTTYTISPTASLLRSARRVLPEAVPPTNGRAPASTEPIYGWVSGVCIAPHKHDRYLVEFMSERSYRIIAYVDRFARVFTTSEPLASPPARMPSLDFAPFSEYGARGSQRGTVRVLTEDGRMKEVARYEGVQGRYAFSDSWFNFGPYGAGLSYDDALARAYFAFVARPLRGGYDMPERGIGFVAACLRHEKLLRGLRCIVDTVRRVEADPFGHPPALARCLVRWLNDAGLAALTPPTVPDDALRLVRTARYANMFYVARENAQTAIDTHTIWALEGALNRLLLIDEAFGESASLASEADCARWDAYLMEAFAAQAVSCAPPSSAPLGIAGGEWNTRCRIAAAIERLKLPLRIEVALREDVTEGVVAFEVTVPDAALMPSWCWSDAPERSGWALASPEARESLARRYTMRSALALAALVFEASPALQRVDVTARPLSGAFAAAEDGGDEKGREGAGGGEFPRDESVPASLQVTLTRSIYDTTDHFREALHGDPAPLLAQSGALIDVGNAEPFATIASLPSAKARQDLPETEDMVFSEVARAALGVDRAADMRIVADAHRRRIGEVLAERVVRAATVTEAIRMVREEQEAASERDDDLAVAACTRLMAGLVGGSLDAEDQNAVVSCFLGEDRCRTALAHASTLAQSDPQEALGVLMDAVAETALLDGFVDGATTVYRSFDSYLARVLYERARQAVQQDGVDHPKTVFPGALPTLASRAKADACKHVRLVSDSFYLCHLEIISLLERSFERVDDALRYGQRAIELAPASAGGYRQLGRAYMLVGDMENAVSVLGSCLSIATQPIDIAIAYYQLAYALWKVGRPRAGAACYLKSVTVSPVVALHAMSEFKELAAEHNLDPLEQDEIDDALTAAGIVIAPTNAVLDIIEGTAAAATDAGLFPVAHHALSLRLYHRPDDALVSVLRSLENF